MANAGQMFDFCPARKEFNKVVEKVIEEDSLEPYKTFVQDFHGSESEKRVTIDQALRDVLRKLSSQDRGCEVYRKFICLAIDAVISELCSASVPFMLLTDIFDVIPLDQCEDLFGLVEDKVQVWKSPTFYDTGKNYLLRMCNDLLRRLSKSQNTVFCGRIQLFLSRLFPLSEKSALNLMSQFNLENVTLFNQSKQEVAVKSEDQSTQEAETSKDGEVKVKEETMEIEEGEMEDKKSQVPIDYNLYRKFWSLQDIFRKPSQCFEKRFWPTFTANADAVLDVFTSSKLDDLKSSKKKLNQRRSLQTDAFFAKYLTSEKLLDLQLNDSNFRRYVLVQFLITFQYLGATIKFKSQAQVLTEEQTTWLKGAQERIYQLICETPPDGDSFATTVENVLAREEHWSSWKNESCRDFEKKPPKDAPKPVRKAKRRRIGDDLQSTGGKVIKMGNPELTKLWNLNPSNMGACQAENRMFLPTMEDFFQDAIDMNDPEAQVEEAYKPTNDQTFQWKALRLLARRSPQFFTNTTTPALELKVYLNGMLEKLAKQMPNQPGEEMKTEIEEEEEIKESQEDEEELKGSDEQQKDLEPKELTLNKEIFEQVSDKLGADWKQLGSELNFPEDDINYFDSEGNSHTEKAMKILTIWQETEGDKATASALRVALKEVGLNEIGESVLGPS